MSINSAHLTYREHELYLENVRLQEIANALGTPAYVYSKRAIGDAVEALRQAFAGIDHRIHYAVKANSNLAVMRHCLDLGCGFDIVSSGELSRVLAVGGNPAQVLFSGVGKSIEEIDFALKADIGCFNIESAGELTRLRERARLLGRQARISVRVNPDVDAGTHPYISTGLQQNKFGVDPDQALALYAGAEDDPYLQIIGIDCHIGSQISEVEPLLQALANLLLLVDELAARGIELAHIDLGGGMGVTYDNEAPFDLEAYGSGVHRLMAGRSQQVLLEPGRYLTANAGVLLTRVEYLKLASHPDAPNFAVVDAAMNDLIRPALYQAWHGVLPLHESGPARTTLQWDIVGPVCESGDFLARSRALDLDESAILAVTSAGAYGMVQASNYNSRGRACEVLIDGDTFRLVRRRETIQDQLRLECGE